MKTRRSAPSAYFNLPILLALAAVGVLLTTLVAYGAQRTRNSKPQRKRLLHFILRTEASQKRGLTGLMAPLTGAIMDTMLRQMQLATFSLLAGSKLQRGIPTPTL